jgi:conjugative relaxase-like TrwC/TraI family protein
VLNSILFANLVCLMLSIGKIALGQHRYYEQQVARGGDDYYSGRGEAPGEWIGAGAEALGLSDRVTTGQFNALIAGLDPRDPDARLRSSLRDPKIAAFDLTFSAPKSVSILFAIAPETVSGVLVDCHEEAVRAALGYLEDTAVMVRRGHGGERVEAAEGLIAAAYRHRMSRALDPQLHTHVVAGNLAQGPDGRFTALHSTLLYAAAKTTGTLYQAHLRALVTERLGLEWGEVHKGAAELADVLQPVIEHFSKRRHEMLREAQEGGIGLGTKASAERAALATRDRKQYGLETHTWREEVRARASELGLGAQDVEELLQTRTERIANGLAARGGADEHALGDLLAGAEGLTERANTFDEHPVLQEFAGAARTGALVEEVRAQAQRFVERADVIPTDRGEMTTAELISCERRLIASAIGRGEEGVAIVDPTLVDRAVADADRPLTTEQAAAVRMVIGSGHGVSVIQALAGTGKTYTAGVLRQVYASAGYQVLGVAPTGRGARELAAEAGIPARTLDRLLLDLDVLGDELPEGCVIVLDEAGMAPTRGSARLLEAAEQTGAKVIGIGDPGQLASVQAGGWLGAVGRELGTVRLTEVMRQRDPAERRALGALHDRSPQSYLEWADHAGRIQTYRDPAEVRIQAIDEWARATAALGPAQAVMIARDNDTRDALNHAARELRRDLGELGEERSYDGLELAVGDRVICRRNDSAVDVDNGMRGTVRQLDPDRVVIDTDSGLLRELPADYASAHLEHAYALTGHGMQGGTVEAATVVASPHDLTAGWSYTALSRARGHTRLLVYDNQYVEDRSEFAPTDQAPAFDRRDLLARVARRMLERDDEDLAIEQLPGAGRADEPQTAVVRTPTTGLQQEHAAARAEPIPADASTEQLHELRDLIQALRAQLEVLPTRQLRRVEDLDARAITLGAQREQITERLGDLPQPSRRFGREQDPSPVERAHLTGALQAADRELDAVLTRRDHLARELGDPAEIRAEYDGLYRALAQLTREHTDVRNDLAEREVHAPGTWVQKAFGGQPDEPQLQEAWEQGVRQAARYRIQYNITDPDDPLGPKPEQRDQHLDWRRAHEAVDRTDRRLGRDVDVDHDLGVEVGP